MKATQLEKARAKLDSAELTAEASRLYLDSLEKKWRAGELKMASFGPFTKLNAADRAVCVARRQLGEDIGHARALLHTAERAVAKARIAFITAGGTL